MKNNIIIIGADHNGVSQKLLIVEDLEREVRKELDIPFNPPGANVKFEHSMGQGSLPSFILRTNY